MARNYKYHIMKTLAQATETECIDGAAWYTVAKHEAQKIADRYELPLHIVVGVVAALSPTNKWERNVIDADALCAAYVGGDYMESVKVCTYKTMKEKAWGILSSNGDREATRGMLKGPKITDFFDCILGVDTCVIDGHAWCIANGERRTMQEVPNIGKALRESLQQAYRDVGKQADLPAYVVQAVTWLAWRRIHGVK